MDSRPGRRLPDTLTPASIERSARSVLGSRWSHLGRDPQFGLDCIGLIAHVYTDHGLTYRIPENYPIWPKEGLLLRYMRDNFEIASPEFPVPSDPDTLTDFLRVGRVLVFCIRRRPQHVGIVTRIRNSRVPRWGLIHTDQSIGRVEEVTLEHRKWLRRVTQIFTYPGVQED